VKKKQFLFIIAGLIVLNIATITYFLLNSQDNGETVAKVGDEKITRQEWLSEMEARYGESALKDIIDQRVIEQMAKKYDITVSDKDINRELTLLKTSSYLENQNSNDEKLKEQVRLSLLFEEILTKDAVVSNDEMEKYYEVNKASFVIPTSYQLSQIIVHTKKEAEQTIKELKQGSSFSVLAMERSIDGFSANQGGDIGFVNEEEERIPPDVFSKIKKLKTGNWTQPIKTEEGYAIYLLEEKIAEKKYSYKEVKNQIRRKLALEQMDRSVTADVLWKEVKVDWFYGNKEN
jgi:foldase protein PrsA